MPAITLVTTTFYKSTEEPRFHCAIKTCKAAREEGFSVIVVDGSPNPDVRNALIEAGANVEPQKEKGMGASRMQCFQAGWDKGGDFFVWLEPEKFPLVPFIGGCVKAMAEYGYNILVPARLNLLSYPRIQQWSELTANMEIGRVTWRPDIDWMFGPKMMDRTGMELFVQYVCGTNEGYHKINVPVLQALAAPRFKVGSRHVGYVHPSEQTAEEEGNPEFDKKRDDQRETLIRFFTDNCQRLGIQPLP